MTKKGSKTLSLKDFYATTPGQLPIEHCLPSKPGENARCIDQQQQLQQQNAVIEKQFGDLGLKGSGKHSIDGPSYERNGSGSYGRGGSYYGDNSRDPYAPPRQSYYPDGPTAYGSREGYGRPDGYVNYPYREYQSGPHSGPDRYSYDAPERRQDQNGSGGGYGGYPPAPPSHGDSYPYGAPPPPPPPPPPRNGSALLAGSNVPNGHPVSDGPLGYGPMHDVHAPPPPPPPPARNSAMHYQQEHIVSKAANGGEPQYQLLKRPESHQQPTKENQHPPVASPRGAKPVSALTQQEKAAANVKPSEPEAPPKQEEQQAPAVKNEWADKLAQQVAAKLANQGAMKSSLLAGDAGSPPTSNGSALANGILGNGVVKPSHPLDRPRLNLQPRTTSLPPAPSADRQGSTSDAPGAAPTAAEDRPRLKLQPRSVPLSEDSLPPRSDDKPPRSDDNGGRPRLNLLPRSKPVSTDSDADGKKPSVFGAARPREQVLKGRGVELGSADSERILERERINSAHIHSRTASVTSAHSEDVEWHTVGARGKAKSTNLDKPDNPLDEIDPFFGNQSAPVHIAKPFPAARAFNHDVMNGGYEHGGGSYGRSRFDSHGSHGSPNHRGSYSRTSYMNHGDDEDSSVPKRNLPTRGDFF